MGRYTPPYSTAFFDEPNVISLRCVPLNLGGVVEDFLQTLLHGKYPVGNLQLPLSSALDESYLDLGGSSSAESIYRLLTNPRD